MLLATRRVVLARELPGGLDGLGAAGAEEHAVQVAGRERRDLGRQLDRARVRVRPVRVEGQLAHLLVRGLADLVAERVADVDREEARQRVDVAPAVRVLEVAAVAADDDRDVVDLVSAHAGEVHPEVLLGGVLQVDGLDGGHRGSSGSFGASVLPEDVLRAIAIATRKIALATTFTCGGTATRAIPQTKIGERLRPARIEVRDDEVVDGERESEQRSCEHRGRDQGQRHLAERRDLVRAEVHRRLLEVPVEADQARLHGDHDEAHDEHHVRDEDRDEPELEDRGRVQEQREERGAEDDLRRRHREEHEDVGRSAPDEVMADDRHRDERPERRGHDRREQADLERRDDRVLDAEHGVPVGPVVERELLPDVVEAARGLVEREEDHDGDREHQVADDEQRVDGQRVALHERPGTGRETAPGAWRRVGDGRHPVSLSDPTIRA